MTVALPGVIASAAKQSRGRDGRDVLDCFVASLLAMTVAIMAARAGGGVS
jgi:hypothetical protein